MTNSDKKIYRFGSKSVDGDGSMRELLGGKGAGLAEMSMLSIPVPPGFTITTDVCRFYLEQGTLPRNLKAEIAQAVRNLESEAGKGLGNAQNPLLVSVRSGAPISMPGMMDTILNVGLNDACLEGLAAKTGSRRFALDSYRRLIQMFGAVVLNVPKHAFDHILDYARHSENVATDPELSEKALEGIVRDFKAAVLEHKGYAFPQDPQQQLALAIEAVFQSWRSERAQCYRKLNNIANHMGTAVTVQAMVFGNLGMDSGTGVGFTRNPSTGDRHVFGEFLANAQGEDIVAGTRTPVAIAELARTMPAVYAELDSLTSRLETHYRDVQDFEFTIESGKLYLLQTRDAKRAAAAAVQIAVDMVAEGLISKSEAVQRVKPASIQEILSPQLDFSNGTPEVIATGIPASPGAAVGRIALSANQAVSMAAQGETVVLVTEETTADDIHGMAASVGFLTARGGATSHAAVVARGMGKCCITGARGITVNTKAGTAEMSGQIFRAGDWLSLEATTGRVFAGKLPLRAADSDHPALDTLLAWSRELSSCKVRANADTPEDAANARAHGAAGIGLCRTEHMFFAPDRLPLVRKMICAETVTERIEALAPLLPMQQGDFEAIFRSMSGLPVTVRLLDPPLHEFLPSVEEIDTEIVEARSTEDWERGIELEKTRRRVQSLHETNPMMGHRGCRLSLTYPEILDMQVRAILQAALAVTHQGYDPRPEIMVPLVASEEEMRVLAELIHKTAGDVFDHARESVKYAVGTMIELPRAAVCAASIAKHVSFMSFGTNDLTQMTYGFSRDDARSFIDSYLEQGILKNDPFVTIDQEGVGALVAMAVQQARATNPKIKLGICGEHGGDPESIRFFRSPEVALEYVSCSTSRLPIAQLAAMQAEPQRIVKYAEAVAIAA